MMLLSERLTVYSVKNQEWNLLLFTMSLQKNIFIETDGDNSFPLK